MLECEFIKLCNRQKYIIIYGAGMVGGLVYKRLLAQKLDKKIIGFAVTKLLKDNGKLFEKQIYEIDDLRIYKKEALVIISTMPNLQDEIENNLKRLGFEHVINITEQLYINLCKMYIQDFEVHNSIEQKNIDIVFMASDNNASSGAFLCMTELNESLNKRGFKTLIVLPEYGDGEEILKKKELLYTYIPSKNWCVLKQDVKKDISLLVEKENQLALETLEKICKKHHVRLIHNNTTYTYIGAIVAKRLGIPVVWHLREDVLVQGYDFIDRERAIAFINKSDKIVVVSKFINNCIEGLETKRVEIVYDGVDVESYYIEKDILNNQEQVTIVMIGAVIPIKGQKQLIEAMHLLEKYELPSIKCLFIGKGDKEYINELRKMVRNYQLEDNIEFLGMQSNVPQFYQKADIAVVCSQADSFGRIIIEAQLAGCIVIGADTGATVELIDSEKTGLLYRYGNIQDLADKIEMAIKNKNKLRKIAKYGQKQAVLKYTKERNTTEIEKIYLELLKRDRAEEEKCIMQKS